MSNNQTIDGVPRELLERIAQWGSVSWPDKNELRALLAAPVVERQAEVVAHRLVYQGGAATEWNDEAPEQSVLDQEREGLFHIELAYGRPQPDEVDITHVVLDDSYLERLVSTAKSLGKKFTVSSGRLELMPAPVALTNESSIQADHDRLVRELDVLLNGEAGAAEQASLCDIVAQVRWARKKPGTGPLQLWALIPDQVVGRVHRVEDVPDQAYVDLNSVGRALPEGAPLYTRPADTLKRYVRAPSRKDPKYHEEWPEIEGGPVFDGVTYCNDLFEALKRFNVIVAETMPEGAVDE